MFSSPGQVTRAARALRKDDSSPALFLALFCFLVDVLKASSTCHCIILVSGVRSRDLTLTLQHAHHHSPASFQWQPLYCQGSSKEGGGLVWGQRLWFPLACFVARLSQAEWQPLGPCLPASLSLPSVSHLPAWWENRPPTHTHTGVPASLQPASPSPSSSRGEFWAPGLTTASPAYLSKGLISTWGEGGV